MLISKGILCIIFTSFAVHYGWKMRGTVVGGEKGAMVPGLFAGLIPALFAGGAISKYFWIPAAAGLIGMSYGGIEPYGDSIALINDPDYVTPNPKKGYVGLMLKGALWFSICGGYIGMSMSSMGSVYSVKDIIIFFFMVNAFQFIGYRIFNQPYNEEKKIYPRIYLSFESRDEWGSNVGVLVAIIVMAGIHKDFIALIMALCGFVFGAIGWVAAMRIYHLVENPMKNGKYLFGVFSRKQLIGGWGCMEYTLGTFGGFGIALGFVLAFSNVKKINTNIAENGLFSPFENYEFISIIIVALCFIALLIINFSNHQKDEKDIKYNTFIMDCVERPFFNTIPFTLVLLCALPAARLMTAFMAIYALCIKNWFDRLKKSKSRSIFIIISGIICILMFVLDLIIGGFHPIVLAVSCCLPYIFCEIFHKATCGGKFDFKKLLKFNNFSFTIILLSVQSIIITIFVWVVSVLWA